VQIMSPHFLAQPDSPVLVPPSRWQATPAGTAPSQVGARHADSNGTSPAEPPRP
jgi:hypothetical protein